MKEEALAWWNNLSQSMQFKIAALYTDIPTTFSPTLLDDNLIVKIYDDYQKTL